MRSTPAEVHTPWARIIPAEHRNATCSASVSHDERQNKRLKYGENRSFDSIVATGLICIVRLAKYR
jgi:hypothetical protein